MTTRVVAKSAAKPSWPAPSGTRSQPNDRGPLQGVREGSGYDNDCDRQRWEGEQEARRKGRRTAIIVGAQQPRVTGRTSSREPRTEQRTGRQRTTSCATSASPGRTFPSPAHSRCWPSAAWQWVSSAGGVRADPARRIGQRRRSGKSIAGEVAPARRGGQRTGGGRQRPFFPVSIQARQARTGNDRACAALLSKRLTRPVLVGARLTGAARLFGGNGFR